MIRPTADEIRNEPAGRRLDRWIGELVALLASLNETAPAQRPGQQ